MKVKPLDRDKTEEIYNAMREGASLARKGNFEDAGPHYIKAWEMVPEPKLEWDMSQITVIRMAKFFCDASKFVEALKWADRIFECDPLPNDPEPYIVKGSIFFRAGEIESAREMFNKAYELGGKRGFRDEDPQYLSMVSTKKGRKAEQ